MFCRKIRRNFVRNWRARPSKRRRDLIMRFLRCVSQQEPFSTSFHTTLTIIVIIIKEMLHPIKRECEIETLLELILFLEISLDTKEKAISLLSASGTKQLMRVDFSSLIQYKTFPRGWKFRPFKTRIVVITWQHNLKI